MTIDPLQILVVDDRLDAVRALASQLVAEGHRVDIAGSGVDARARLQQRQAAGTPVQAVIAAIDMRPMDGLALVTAISRTGLNAEFALLASSGTLPIDVVSAARSVGCRHVLTRPVDRQQLVALLQDADLRRRGRRSDRTPDAGEPFFGTTRMWRATRSTATPPAAPPAPTVQAPIHPPSASSGDLVAPEFEETTGPFSLPTPTQPLQPITERHNGATRMLRSTRPPGTGSHRIQRPASPDRTAAIGDGSSAVHQALTRQPGSSALTPASGSLHRPTTQAIRREPSETGLAAGGTARIRRSVTGAQVGTGAHTPPAGPAVTRSYICSHCARTLQVPVRPEAFGTVCIHCGQLIRVLPA